MTHPELTDSLVRGMSELVKHPLWKHMDAYLHFKKSLAADMVDNAPTDIGARERIGSRKQIKELLLLPETIEQELETRGLTGAENL